MNATQRHYYNVKYNAIHVFTWNKNAKQCHNKIIKPKVKLVFSDNISTIPNTDLNGRMLFSLHNTHTQV